MGFKVTNDGTSGSIIDGTIFSYNYDEQATSITPTSLDGGSGSVSFSAIGTSTNKSGSTYINSLLLINNNMTLTDDDRGSVSFKVKSSNLNNSDVVSVSGETSQRNLNVIRRAAPYTGTVAGALLYYTGLCPKDSTAPIYFDDSLSTLLAAIPADYLGWEDNVWNKLKELCAVTFVTVSGVKRNIELYYTNSELHVRLANKTAVTLDSVVSESFSVNADRTAQSFEISLYKTDYAANKVFYEIANIDGSLPKKERFKSTIQSSMAVQAGETVRQRFKINATLSGVLQPVLVEAITDKLPNEPYTGTTGQYVIMADDGLPVVPQQWLDAGGSLTVSLNDENGEPLEVGEIEITLVGPPEDFTGRIDPETGEEVKTTSYAVGIEDIYPAIWIVGTGTFYELEKHKIVSGAANTFNADESITAIENIFINDVNTLYNAGVRAAQAACGPTVDLSVTAADLTDFGALVGGVLTEGSNKYRITSVTHSQDSINVTASAGAATFAQFDAIWSGKDFSDFTPALKFNEFTVIPLLEAN